jgi:opacity protein-like surface antigen
VVVQVGHGALVTSNQGPRTGGEGFVLDVTRASHGGLAGLFAGYGAVLGRGYLGLEVEGDMSAIDWNIERDPNGRIYSAQHKWSFGGSARAGVLIGNSALLYGRAGLVRTRFDVPYATSGTSVRSLETRTGERFGGGIEIGLGGRARLRADYTLTDYSAYSIEYGHNSDRFDHSETLFRLGLSWRL